MPNFELTYVVTCLQKRHVQVEAPDAATAKQRVWNGCLPSVVGREVVLFKAPFHCKEIAAAPANLKATTDSDGCPVWIPE